MWLNKYEKIVRVILNFCHRAKMKTRSESAIGFLQNGSSGSPLNVFGHHTCLIYHLLHAVAAQLHAFLPPMHPALETGSK